MPYWEEDHTDAMKPLEKGDPVLVGPMPFTFGWWEPVWDSRPWGTAWLSNKGSWTFPKSHWRGVDGKQTLGPSVLAAKTRHPTGAPSILCLSMHITESIFLCQCKSVLETKPWNAIIHQLLGVTFHQLSHISSLSSHFTIAGLIMLHAYFSKLFQKVIKNSWKSLNCMWTVT